jgi:hypothetical protein
MGCAKIFVAGEAAAEALALTPPCDFAMKARDNPFRSERIDALRYRARDFSWDELETRLERAQGRGALVGPKGHGKTALLDEWAARCEARGEGVIRLRIREGQRFLDGLQREKLRACAADASVFLDSAEQLSAPGWWELRWRVRQASRFVITAHRPGLLPTVRECRTSAELLADLVCELTGERRECAALWARHGGNVREALFELYLRAADGDSDRAERGRVTQPVC